MNKIFVSFLLVSCFGCACAFAQGETGTTTITTDFYFPPVSMMSTDTISLNLVNIAPAPTSATATAPSCTGTVTFAGSNGTIGMPDSFTLGAGKMQTVSLTGTGAGISSGRGGVLVSVQTTTTRPATAPCTLIFALQLYDSSGVTHVYLGNTSATTQGGGANPLSILLP